MEKGAGAATILVDNKSAIQLCKNWCSRTGSKHIEMRYHFIRECIEGRKINVDYIATGD